MQSLGDFFLKIAPQFDTTAMSKGVQKVNDMGKSANKTGASMLGSFRGAALGVAGAATATVAAGAKILDVLNDTAQANVNLANSARAIGMTPQALQVARRQFEFLGKSGEEADATIGRLQSTIGGMKFGEADFKAFAQAHVDISKLKNPGTMWAEIRKALSGMNANERQFFAGKLGVQDQLGAIMMPQDQLNKIVEASKMAGTVTDKQISESQDFRLKSQTLGMQWDSAKNQFLSSTMPAASGAIDSLSALLKDKAAMEGLAKLASLLVGILGMAAKLGGALGTGLGSGFDFMGQIKDVATGKGGSFKKIAKSYANAVTLGQFDKVTGMMTNPQGAMAAAGTTSAESNQSANVTNNVTNNINGGDHKEVHRIVKGAIADGTKEIIQANSKTPRVR